MPYGVGVTVWEFWEIPVWQGGGMWNVEYPDRNFENPLPRINAGRSQIAGREDLDQGLSRPVPGSWLKLISRV